MGCLNLCHIFVKTALRRNQVIKGANMGVRMEEQRCGLGYGQECRLGGLTLDFDLELEALHLHSFFVFHHCCYSFITTVVDAECIV